MDALDLVAKIKLDISEYENGLTTAEKDAKGFGSKLSSGLGTAAKVGAAAVAAVGTAATVAGKKLWDGAQDMAAYGDNVDKMSQKIGISAKAYQEWDAVFQHSGASVNSLQQGMKTLNNQMNKVKTAADLAKSPFAQLGLSLEEVQTIAKDPDKALETVISHLQELPAGAERSALATQLLGRSGVELGALLNTTAEETQKMRDRVHELGGVMSDEAVKASAKFQDNMQDLHTALDGVKRSIIGETLPAFNDLIEGFTKLIAGEEGAEEVIDRGVEKMAAAIDVIIPKLGDLLEKLLPRVLEIGGKLVIALAEQIPKIITSIAKQIPNLIKQLIQAITKMFPQLVKAGVDLLKELAEGMKNGTGQAVDTIIELLKTIFDSLLDAAPQIIEAGLTLLENLLMGIIENLPKIVDTVILMVNKFVQSIAEHLPEILMKGKDIILNLVKGITENLPRIVESIVEGIKMLIQTIVDNLPEILQAGIEIIIELAKGLIAAIPELVAKIPEIIMSIVGALLDPENIGKIFDAGLQMIGELFEGLLGGDFLGALADIGEALLGAVAGALGALFELGGKIVGAIFDGIKSAWGAVVDWVEGAIEGIMGDPMAKYNDPNYDPNAEWWESTGKGLDQAAKVRQANKQKSQADYAGSSSMVARYNNTTNVYVGTKRVATEMYSSQAIEAMRSGGGK